METMSRYLRVLCWVAALLVFAIPALSWGPEAAALPPQKMEGRIISTLPFPIVAWGLLQLSGFSRKVGAGLPFTTAASSGLRRFGWALVAGALLLIPCRAAGLVYETGESAVLLSAALWRPAPVLATLLGAIMGFITILFARILDQATEIAEENASFL